MFTRANTTIRNCGFNRIDIAVEVNQQNIVWITECSAEKVRTFVKTSNQVVQELHLHNCRHVMDNVAYTDSVTKSDRPLIRARCRVLDIQNFQVVDQLNGAPRPHLLIGNLATADLSGTHTGSNNASVLTDSGQSWTVNEFVGLRVFNTTDGSYGEITANTATTITAALGGGTGDDWDTSDAYEIRLVSSRIKITGCFGLTLDDIDAETNAGLPLQGNRRLSGNAFGTHFEWTNNISDERRDESQIRKWLGVGFLNLD